MATRHYHMGIDVRGVLGWGKRDRLRLFKNGNGGALQTDEQVRDWLLDQLAGGNEMIPFGAPCDNWSKKEGCKGHATPPPAAPSPGEGAQDAVAEKTK